MFHRLPPCVRFSRSREIGEDNACRRRPIQTCLREKIAICWKKACVWAYIEKPCSFELKFSVGKGCPLSAVLLRFAVDWAMRCSVDDYQFPNFHRLYYEPRICGQLRGVRKDLTTFQAALERVNEYASTIGFESNVKTLVTLGGHYKLNLRN